MNSVLCGFFVTFNLQDALQDPPLCYHFILGYLRCTSFPNPPPPLKKNAQFPPKNIVIITVHKQLYRKNHQTRRGQCTHCNISPSKLCLKMHEITSQGIFISKTFRMGMPPNPARKLVVFGHSGVLLPQTINPRENPARSLYLQCSISTPTQPRFLGFGGFGGKRAFLRVWRKQKKQSILSTWAILLFFIDPSYLPFPPLLRL